VIPEGSNPLPKPGNTLEEMKKRSTTQVLASNLKVLMEQHPSLDTDRKLGKAAGVSHKTVNNIVNERHNVQLENVEKLAKAFKIEPFQLLCPDTDSAFLTICQVYSGTSVEGRSFLAATVETIKRTYGVGNKRPDSKSGEGEH
jgi:transcriptional regulator with XRE-family HTH domain